MAEKHIANKESKWRAVNTTPDFCKVGIPVVPFDIFRDLSNAIIYSPNVYARGAPVLTVTSRIQGVVGDTGSGVVSQVSMGAGYVVITSGSSTVNTNRLQTAYNLSDCLMNVGGAPNCAGKVLTEQGAPAKHIENKKLPCNDPPKSSPKLEQLKRLQEKLKSEDPREVLDFIRPSEAEQTVQGGIDKIQTPPDSLLHPGAGVTRALLGVANRFVFDTASLVKMGAEALVTDQDIAFMRQQVDAELLAENIRLGNCTDQRALWERIKQTGAQIAKPITVPWSKGEYAEALTAGGLEALMLLGPVLGKLGEVGDLSKVGRSVDIAEADRAGRASKAIQKLDEVTETEEVIDVAEESSKARRAKLPEESNRTTKTLDSEEAAESRGLDGVRINKRRKNRAPTPTNRNIDHAKTTKHPDGSTTYYDLKGRSVTYDKEGYPDFSPYAETGVQSKKLTGIMPHDKNLANEAVGLKSTPEGYVWHHVEDGETMLLIPDDIHEFPHTGGASIIKSASP